ncbi:MAG: hypothetical protein R2712_07860 [Vicinamibacterales bacterium]
MALDPTTRRDGSPGATASMPAADPIVGAVLQDRDALVVATDPVARAAYGHLRTSHLGGTTLVIAGIGAGGAFPVEGAHGAIEGDDPERRPFRRILATPST